MGERMTESSYLDNHSATRPFPSVSEQMMHFMKEYWAASSAPHFLGQQSSFPLQKSMEAIYEALGASPQDRCILHGSAAEAVNHVFFSHYFHQARESGKTLFLTSNIEDAPSCLSLKRLEQLGCTAKLLPVNANGQLTKEVLAAAITPRTALFSISWANGLTGVVHPILDLAEVCQEKGVLFHVDASYVFAKHFFRFQDLHAHFLTLNSGVIHGPKCGLTLIKSDTAASPFVVGKSNEDVATVVGLSQTLQLAQSYLEHHWTETVRLRDKLEQGICQTCPEARVLFKESERLPNCTAILFPGIVNEALLYLINAKGVYATMGGGESQILSHLLVQCGIEETLAHSALSFSLSYETTEEEIDYAIEIIAHAVKQLRACSVHLFERETNSCSI
jgi:cysteine desulfurase